MGSLWGRRLKSVFWCDFCNNKVLGSKLKDFVEFKSQILSDSPLKSTVTLTYMFYKYKKKFFFIIYTNNRNSLQKNVDFLVFLGFSYRLRHKYFGGLIYLGSFSRFENWALIEFDVFGGIRWDKEGNLLEGLYLNLIKFKLELID